ncbi:PaaX family transcriptional regulator [Glutamicibacter uratoxydans]|uniref:PaaX family transcriptional regulator n=1 Tax=Glutamicibacter uratoxydans TaxID=43667 RepID=UPI003D6F445D
MGRSSTLQAFTLDDFESRSGSATSLLRSIAGLYLRHCARPVPRPEVLALATAAGVGQAAAQTAVTRLADRGLFHLTAEGCIAISEPAQRMFARGNRRIFTPRHMAEGDLWTLVAYSLPESLRSVRHQLRKHFTQLGGGLVSSGLWIFPQYLQTEVLQVLESLQIRHNATLFETGVPQFAHSALDSARTWWDLEKIAGLHQEFIDTIKQLEPTRKDLAHSYHCYVRLVDAWRAIPYLDPGLPPSMLPEQWPGEKSRELFLDMSTAHRDGALRYAREQLGDGLNLSAAAP